MNIVMIYGSVRSGRLGIKAAQWITAQYKAQGHNAVLVDPLKENLPLLDKRHSDYEEGKSPEQLVALADILTKADLFVVISAEYNASIPPALTNLLDHFWGEYQERPVSIITYSAGGLGGIRVTQHLHDFLLDLGMAITPVSMAIPTIQNAFDAQDQPTETFDKKRWEQFLNKSLWWADAIKEKREKDKV